MEGFAPQLEGKSGVEAGTEDCATGIGGLLFNAGRSHLGQMHNGHTRGLERWKVVWAVERGGCCCR